MFVEMTCSGSFRDPGLGSSSSDVACCSVLSNGRLFGRSR